MTIGQRIEARRRKQGLSQSELARQVGVRQSTINALIRGDSRGSKHLHVIARALQTTTAYLAGEIDDPDTAEDPQLSEEEAKLLSLWRQLKVEDRAALERIMQTMIGPRTLHAPRLGFRSGAPEGGDASSS